MPKARAKQSTICVDTSEGTVEVPTDKFVEVSDEAAERLSKQAPGLVVLEGMKRNSAKSRAAGDAGASKE